MIWKIVITIVAFLAAIAVVSATFEFVLGDSYPAWTIMAAFVVVSPVLFLLWRDRLS
jgi:hypothetical protein